jgi:3'(2'), 5'-bisphosphate nucleotidase
MFNLHTPETKFALTAVRQASLLVRQVQAEMVLATMTKDDRSPVTVADFASQALIGYLLSKALPDDPLVAEEDAATLRQPANTDILARVTQFVVRFIPEVDPGSVCCWIDRGKGEPAHRFWALDPIDGTKGYLRGGQYAVALALIIDGQVQLGVLGCPNLSDGYRSDLDGPGSLVIAARGQGTWTTSLSAPLEYDRLTVSSRSDPVRARLLRSFEADHTNVRQLDHLVEQLGIHSEPVMMDSLAKFAILAAGKGDVIVRLLSPAKPDYREKIWDQAAGSLVVEEAGGKVTDLHGQELDFSTGRELINNRGVLASNGHLHAAILNALYELGT